MVLNEASSSGKTNLARALQVSLPGLWFRFGIDDLLEALPSGLLSDDGLSLGPHGSVTVDAAFRQAEWAWMLGLAALHASPVDMAAGNVRNDWPELHQSLSQSTL